MKVKDIKGGRDYMDVYLEDGRVVEIIGELIHRGFVAYDNFIDEWKVPEGKPISDSERKEIIDAVLEDSKDSDFKITFETYKKLTEEERKKALNAFLEELRKEGFDPEIVN